MPHHVLPEHPGGAYRQAGEGLQPLLPAGVRVQHHVRHSARVSTGLPFHDLCCDYCQVCKFTMAANERRRG